MYLFSTWRHQRGGDNLRLVLLDHLLEALLLNLSLCSLNRLISIRIVEAAALLAVLEGSHLDEIISMILPLGDLTAFFEVYNIACGLGTSYLVGADTLTFAVIGAACLLLAFMERGQ